MKVEIEKAPAPGAPGTGDVGRNVHRDGRRDDLRAEKGKASEDGDVRGGTVVITRILGEGQYEIADAHLGVLGELDAAVQSAAACGDDEECVAGVRALLEAVRDLGTSVPDDVSVPLDLILPDEGTSRRHIRQMQELLADKGLIPAGRGAPPRAAASPTAPRRSAVPMSEVSCVVATPLAGNGG